MRLPIVMLLFGSQKLKSTQILSRSVNHIVTYFRLQAHSSSDEISSQSGWLPPDLFSTILISNTSSSSEVSKSISDRSSIVLKYGFHNKSFILNAPLVSCPIPVIRSGWVQQQTHQKRMTGIGQLTRGAFRINDLL